MRANFVETPVVRLEHERLDLYAKVEYVNPTGSVKDRSAYMILDRAIARGELTPDTTVVESSSGNFAIALSSFCRVLGIPFIPVIDPNTNPITEQLLRVAGNRIEKVAERDETGGYLRTRLKRVGTLLDEVPGAYWTNQYTNPDAAAAHANLTFPELHRKLPRIDYLFVGVGTGATITGLSQRLHAVQPRAIVVAVDVDGSVIFGGPPARRHIPGIGSSIRPPLLDEAEVDDLVMVSERETIAACHRLLRRHGIFAGGSTGSVYAAIEQYFWGWTGPAPTVAFLCADRGTAYGQSVYTSSWLGETAGPVETAGPAMPGTPAEAVPV